MRNLANGTPFNTRFALGKEAHLKESDKTSLKTLAVGRREIRVFLFRYDHSLLIMLMT